MENLRDDIEYSYYLKFKEFPPTTTIAIDEEEYLKLVIKAIEMNKPLTLEDIEPKEDYDTTIEEEFDSDNEGDYDVKD